MGKLDSEKTKEGLWACPDRRFLYEKAGSGLVRSGPSCVVDFKGIFGLINVVVVGSEFHCHIWSNHCLFVYPVSHWLIVLFIYLKNISNKC